MGERESDEGYLTFVITSFPPVTKNLKVLIFNSCFLS